MKQKAMDVKLVVRPLIGCLTHTHFWEGPCRAGRGDIYPSIIIVYATFW